MTTKTWWAILWGLLLSVALPAIAQTDDPYTVQMLRGARTASIHVTTEPGAGCAFDIPTAEDTKEVIDRLRPAGLHVVSKLEEELIPDMSILVLLETSRSKSDGPDGTCSMFVKLEVYHQLAGTLRYSGARPILRALVYHTFRYGSAPSNEISSAVRSSARRSLHEFELAFRNANRPFGSK